MTFDFSQNILNLPRRTKRIVAVCVDTALCLITVFFAYWLRLGAIVIPADWQWLSYALAVVLALPFFITFGLYRAIFRYAGWGALLAILRACGLFGAAYCIVFTLVGVPGVPRSLGILQPLLLFMAVVSSRAWIHYWLGDSYKRILRLGEKQNVLIYGAGSAGRQIAAGLANSNDMQVVAFVDDDITLQGSVLNGKHIYDPKAIRGLILRFSVDIVLLAIPSASRQRKNEIVDDLRNTTATVRTLPGITDLAHGHVTVNSLRELDIEDLLGRDAVPPIAALLTRNITGKTVLITGAGGSIGSELCRQIIELQPKQLVLVDHSEFNLYAIEHELMAMAGTMANPPTISAYLGSVTDYARMDKILGQCRPHTIYHAAAYKHVPIVEENPSEGMKNNVFGTRNMALLAVQHEVSHFVLISTDKAVRPSNIMGATKRFAEMVLQAIAKQTSGTRFAMVRFGNVLGSSGSVIPMFRKQIATGGPVTVTHRDVTRYFMTIPEAAQLVIQAGAMAEGGDVFVLDMGEPVRIFDLATRMIELSGLSVRDDSNPGGDIEIKLVGLRPAEKLYEELLIGNNPEETVHPRIMKAHDTAPPSEIIDARLARFESIIAQGDSLSLRTELLDAVPEYGEYIRQNGGK